MLQRGRKRLKSSRKNSKNSLKEKNHLQGEENSSSEESPPVEIEKEAEKLEPIEPVNLEIVPVPASLLEALEMKEFRAYPFPVFGQSLDKLLSVGESVPYIVKTSMQYLLTEEGLRTQGLFRIPGSKDDILLFRQQFDEGREVNFSAMKDCSYHDVAGLLKEFLRSLPEPIIPSLYNCQAKLIIEENKHKENDQQVLQSLREVIQQLPKENLQLFEILIKFLSCIANNAHINMMSIDNLIKCIVPTLECSPALFYYPLTNLECFFGTRDSNLFTNSAIFSDNDERRGRRRDQASRFANRNNRTGITNINNNVIVTINNDNSNNNNSNNTATTTISPPTPGNTTNISTNNDINPKHIHLAVDNDNGGPLLTTLSNPAPPPLLEMNQPSSKKQQPVKRTKSHH